jgi:superfamily II DNA or RNA helicase
MIAMVQTLVNMKQFPLTQYDLMIFDECHHAPASQFYKTAMRCNSYYRLGLTATPKRTDGNELKFIAAIGKIVATKSVIDLINEGYLARPTFKFIKAKQMEGSQPKTYADAYKKQIVGNYHRNEQIATEAIAMINDSRNVLIIVTHINHGKSLQKLIPGSKFISGTTKQHEREQALKDFREKKLKCMISTVMNEGIDVIGLDAILLAASGKSPIRLIQAIGRALRNEPGKRNPIVVDVQDSGKWLRDHSQERRMAIREVFGQ